MLFRSETENTINFSKRDTLSNTKHFITEALKDTAIQTGFSERNIYSVSEKTQILSHDPINGIKLATHEFGKGRSVYMAGMPYSLENSV